MKVSFSKLLALTNLKPITKFTLDMDTSAIDAFYYITALPSEEINMITAV